MLPHLADQFGDGIPVFFAPSFVELFDVIGGLGCVGLSVSRAVMSVIEALDLGGCVDRPGRRRQSGRGEEASSLP